MTAYQILTREGGNVVQAGHPTGCCAGRCRGRRWLRPAGTEPGNRAWQPQPTDGLQPGQSTPGPYRREEFGNGWTQVRGNCDTREVVLETTAGPNAVDFDGDGCADDAPFLDVYTGLVINPNDADVDHVVSLADAWRSGAWEWTRAQRIRFANDQGNLIATLTSVNRDKGDDDPTQWAPPDPAGRCAYARIYRAAKQRWALTLTPAQDQALAGLQVGCPVQ
ncbi:MAG: HNH endonuclease family protein [Actinomycetota bacterium]|nr:HNH endonuclease family protein [Actinomycetota bacterium]